MLRYRLKNNISYYRTDVHTKDIFSVGTYDITTNIILISIQLNRNIFFMLQSYYND